MAEQSFVSKLKSEPAFSQLGENLRQFAQAKAESFGHRKVDESSGEEGPVAEAKREGKKGAITGAVKGFFGKVFGGRGKAQKRPHNIYESHTIGAPIQQVWDAWNDYESMAQFMKGVESVSIQEEGEGEDQQITTDWKAKVWWSKRQWKGFIEESDEPNRLRWRTEANKGTVDGVVVFTELAENATLMTVVIEYRSKGFMEWMGNKWRAQGRRVRLDIKHFARHVMMQPADEDQPHDEEEPEQDESGQPEPEEPTAGPGEEQAPEEQPEPEPEPEQPEEQGSGEEEQPRRPGRREERQRRQRAER